MTVKESSVSPTLEGDGCVPEYPSLSKVKGRVEGRVKGRVKGWGQREGQREVKVKVKEYPSLQCIGCVGCKGRA